MKYLMSIKYDGSRFNGFQRQKNARNVQSEIEKALSKYLDEPVIIKGAGRTDKGVHAYDQKVHFETQKSIKGLKGYLNKSLMDIKIKKIKLVSDNFHARFSVKNKTYIYIISFDKNDDKRYYLYQKSLNIKSMKKCAKLFEGTHNFQNFVSGQRDSYTSTIKSIKFYKLFKRLYIVFNGRSFYRYMVRNLVGSLIQVGKNKVSITEIENMINCKIEKMPNTAPANGLYLVKIRY